jgi:hypothetical protein
MTARTWCSAGDCITVTESTTHPNVIHISTQHDGQPGRAQLTVTRAEYEAFVAGIKAEERARIRQLAAGAVLELHEAGDKRGLLWLKSFSGALLGEPS